MAWWLLLTAGWIVAMVLTFSYEPPPDGETDREHVPRGSTSA